MERSIKTGLMSRTIKTNLRLTFPGGAPLSHGKAELMELIRETGSIRQAAQRMEMSYRRGWLLADELNRMFREPVIATKHGGKSGGGANIFRGHDNVQGITDVGMNPDSLPGYYGIAEGAFKHFAAAWGVDFEWIKKQYAPGMMTKSGMTVSRWVDGVLEKNELIDQDSNLRGLFFWGHAPNSQTRGLEMKKAMDKLDLLVVIDECQEIGALRQRDVENGVARKWNTGARFGRDDDLSGSQNWPRRLDDRLDSDRRIVFDDRKEHLGIPRQRHPGIGCEQRPQHFRAVTGDRADTYLH